MRDLHVVSGTFFDHHIPKELSYLFKYFVTDMQVAWLRYYHLFGSWKRFREHTGHYCTERVLWKYQRRYRKLISVYDEAKSSLTEEGMETILLIESGKYKT